MSNELVLMNDERHLPASLEDLAQFVLVGRDKLAMVRAGIRALDKLDVAEGVRRQKKEEAQMLAEALLDAEVKIGEILARMPKAKNQHQSASNSGVTGTSTKEQAIKQLGFDKMQVSRFQTLAANKDLVEDVKREARENDDLPTRTAVLKAAKIREAEEKLNETRAKAHAEASIAKASNDEILSRIMLGDSVELAKKYPDGIKLVLTDPPYGADFQSNRRIVSEKAEKIANDSNIDEAIQLTSDIMSAIVPKMAYDSAVLMWCNWQYEFEFRQMLKSFGLQIKNSIIWMKPNHGTGDLYGSFAPKHERLLFAVKGRPLFTSFGRLPDVLEGNEFLPTEHPTPKPLDLLSRLIQALTEEGQIVLDPFSGCGSTAVAAIRNGRQFYGSELSEVYWNESIYHVKNEMK